MPLLKSYGFAEALSYGAGREGDVGSNVLPFQVSSGSDWPTAEIFFSPDRKPWFRIELAWLQNAQIGREASAPLRGQTLIQDAREYFQVAKDQGTVSSLFSQFGYHWWSLMPLRKLNAEVALAEKALPSALQMFLSRPTTTQLFTGDVAGGYVSKNLLFLRLPN